MERSALSADCQAITKIIVMASEPVASDVRVQLSGALGPGRSNRSATSSDGLTIEATHPGLGLGTDPLLDTIAQSSGLTY